MMEHDDDESEEEGVERGAEGSSDDDGSDNSHPDGDSDLDDDVPLAVLRAAGANPTSGVSMLLTTPFLDSMLLATLNSSSRGWCRTRHSCKFRVSVLRAESS